MTSFADFGLPTPVVRELSRQGIDSPFPIQTATLPDSLKGRDVLGRGRTGSGKTLAFSLPTVSRLSWAKTSRHPRRPRALVLCPTRELANQINATMEPVAKALGLVTTTIFGGVAQSRQVAALDKGVDIVIACPGRLEDLLNQRLLTLDGIEITVLDEADHMADLGFLPGVTRILAATPADGQRLLFSATLDRGVDGLVRRFLREAVRHELDEASVPEERMTHRALLVESAEDKTLLVRRLASGLGRRILFTRTKHQAKKLAKQLSEAGIPAVDLHGNLSQNARERNLAAFSAAPEEGGVRVLVATDVAARGVHVDGVELVVHVDPPVEHKAYLHRSGRTARAGATGTVVTVALAAQRRELADLLRKAGIDVPIERVTARDAAVDELVGPQAPRAHRVAVVPAARPVVAAPATPGQAASRNRRNRRRRSGRSRVSTP